MKKLSIVLVTIVLCCSAFLFTGCDQAKTVENNSVIPSQYDLSKMEVGTIVDLYPPFDYKLVERDQTEHIIHVKSFTATLLKKNTINKGDLISGYFSKYEIQIEITVNADHSKFAGQKLEANFDGVAGTNYLVFWQGFDENNNATAQQVTFLNSSDIRNIVFTDFNL